MVKKVIALFGLTLVLIFSPFSQAHDKTPSPTRIDVMLVLDNSGSMKKNDPNHLVKKALESFLKSFSGDIQLGIVIFAERAELILPLTSVSQQGVSEKMGETLKRLDYKGRYTDIPAGIERAIYELKKGREDAKKVIVFMTDGIIDTGNKARDEERTSWLKQELLTQANKNNIRIFAIAFTEEADYALIQTIAQRTNGNYYRALKAEDITNVLSSIYGDITKVVKAEKPEETKPSAIGKPAEAKPLPPTWLLIGLGVVGAILIVMTLAVVMKRKEPEESKYEHVPLRILYCEDPRIGRINYSITKNEITIGRTPGVDILIDDNRVSKVHARIIYENGNFYLIDQGSRNGTWVKENRINPREKVPIHHGDEIFLCGIEKDEPKGYRFIFADPTVCPPEVIYKDEGTIIWVDPNKPLKQGFSQDLQDVDETLLHNLQQQRPDEDFTIIKESWCKVHPTRQNIGYCYLCRKQGCDLCIHICTVCGRTFCYEHIREMEGREICDECFSKI